MQTSHSTVRASGLRRRAFASALLGAGLFVAACGGGGGGSSTGPSNNTNPTIPTGPTNITVSNNSFSPTDLTVAPATQVTWTWNTCNDPGYGSAATCVAHNIVWDDGATGSGLQSEGSYQRTFAAAGTYPYHCAVHGTAMSGSVKVQ